VKDVALQPKRQRQFNYHIRHARGELLFSRCWVLGEGETEVTLLPELARHLGKCLERSGIRCVAYRQSDISLFIEVADKMGIHWIALTDNDAHQGKADQKKVRESLGARQEADVLFVMPEDDIEQYLCTAGFTHVYEKFVTQQTQSQISVSKTDPSYFRQLTKAVEDHKIAAIHQVLDEIRAGAKVPKLFENAIDTAIKWAESL
jgi:putative ATP-dependent endonuclease of the OLD family